MHKPLPHLLGRLLGTLLLWLAALHAAMGQTIINQYLPVSSISGNTLTCGTGQNGNSYFSAATVNAPVRVLVVQMQKAAYDNPSGTTETLGKAGNHEVRFVTKYSANKLTLDKPLNATLFDINGSIQVVSYPEYTGDLEIKNTTWTAAAWDGSTGGILAFTVSGTLTLNNATLDANGKGFRGGSKSDTDGNPDCLQFAISGRNGEGTVRNSWQTNTNMTLADATINKANGGGGGTGYNAGGGGGGNFTAGGQGGRGTTILCSPPTPENYAGRAGKAIDPNPFKTEVRLVMGGGGGGGHQNDNQGSGGGAGGGIIIALANKLTTTRSSNITAQGKDAANSGGILSNGSFVSDGTGGGGAGGVIVLQAKECSIASNSLTINASGGDGGDITAAVISYGSGGGGGQGFIYYKIPSSCSPTIVNKEGIAGQGCLLICGPTGNSGANNGSTNNTNTNNWDPTSLPLLDLRLKGQANAKGNLLQWQATWQVDISYYEVERSTDGLLFLPVQRVYADGNSSKAQYEYLDTQHPAQVCYYRLRVVDLHGGYTYSTAISLQADAGTARLLAYPSPLKGQALQLQAQGLQPHAQALLSVFSAMGNLLLELPLRTDAQGGWQAQLPQSATWGKGVYLLRLQQPGVQLVQRVVVE